MKLEIKKTNIKTYLLSSITLTVCLLALITLLGFVSYNEQDIEMQNFTFFSYLVPLGSAIILLAFGVLSSVMYSKVVIEAYQEKQAALFFLYPVSRKKMLVAKLASVFIFIFVTYMLSSLIVFIGLSLINSMFTFMSDRFSWYYLLPNILQLAAFSGSIGIISASIGFNKKSIPTTILSAVIMGSIFCNIIFNLTDGKQLTMLFNTFLVIVLVGASISSLYLANKVEKMEV
ncbi:hypothetical protein RV12_GL002530 [Enterococcus quebecensis]|nr:hypothetical protein RV12_GL002530 [Enterococcus quebecensis]